jgi:hypothetical protein
VVALGLNRSFFQNSIQNKVAGERIEWNFDQNSDQNKVFKKEMCRSKESLITRKNLGKTQGRPHQGPVPPRVPRP